MSKDITLGVPMKKNEIDLFVFKKLYEIGKPFAMLMGLPVLNYQEIGNFFLDKFAFFVAC